MISVERFVERVTFRPQSRDLPNQKCVDCGSMFYSGFKHRWGQIWKIAGVELRNVEGQNPYCEDCAPGLLSESFTKVRSLSGGDAR